MPQVESSRIIHAPVEEVFAFMDQPENQARITPHMHTSRLIERLPNGGARAFYRYRMGGLDFTGHVAATSYQPREKIVFSMSGDITGWIEWRFEALDPNRTRLTYIGDYQLNLPGVGKALAYLLRGFNRREIEHSLENLAATLGVAHSASA